MRPRWTRRDNVRAREIFGHRDRQGPGHLGPSYPCWSESEPLEDSDPNPKRADAEDDQTTGHLPTR